MLEGEQAPRQLIPVRTCCYHPDLRRSVDIHQRARLLLGPKGLPAQLTDLLCATAAEYRVFLLTADTVDRNQHTQEVSYCALQCDDDPARYVLIRSTTTCPDRFRRM
ncbi:hypothetical protein J3A64_000661 [Pseudarthrobacter sp. PvP004]|nr:hypothetical protein [Pseudarthrobacter sp. PvP004]